jgi:polyisoprenoid-binding protein YceI
VRPNVLIPLVAVLLSACVVAEPTTTPTAVPPTPTAVPAKPTAAVPTRTFAIVPDQSQVQVAVQERLADNTVNTDAVLTTRDVKGQLVVSGEGAVVPDRSKFTVNLDSLKSDRGMRDAFIKRSTLQTSTYQNAELEVTELRLNGPAPTTSGPVKGQLIGTLTIHGTARPVVFDLDGTLADNSVKGTARTQVKITDFGMTLPRVPVVASMEDLARLQIDFVANSGA